jgi:hypothetical protein
MMKGGLTNPSSNNIGKRLYDTGERLFVPLSGRARMADLGPRANFRL